MLATTRERRPLSFMATTAQTGNISANKVSALSIMGMQAIQLFAWYPGGAPAQAPLVEFSVDGVNWVFGFSITAATGTGGLGFRATIPIVSDKFVRVTLGSAGANPIYSNVQITPFTGLAC